ncbi:S-4TM family putative pore-forming effector [Hamadaea sp. NPDC051192]|uniref:S-4TM family putative pore-forming effector n=1 Tax=Hamadaea sp. NPDC051192 TaxID=3154940 RepID=UPI003422AC1D
MPITNPPIGAAQNSDRALRMLAAQRRLYSDAKAMHGTRIITVAAGAIVAVIAALALPQWRTPIGITTGVALMLISFLGSAREKRKVKEAASIQEEFDVMLFGLSWNDIHADRPTPTLIAEADRRYGGGRDGLRDWYPDTGNVPHPMNVLICQHSNLGWGATLHRAWAAALTGILLTLVLVSVLVAYLGSLGFVEALTAIFAPQLPLIKELIEMIKANNESVQTKVSVESKVLGIWRRGLNDPASVTVGDCRTVQDKILQIRQANASIPDWFNNLMRSRQESTMRASAAQMVAEANTLG